jgi:hypothetical protein
VELAAAMGSVVGGGCPDGIRCVLHLSLTLIMPRLWPALVLAGSCWSLAGPDPAARQPVAYPLAPAGINHHLRRPLFLRQLLGFLRGLRQLERFTRESMHHLAVVAVVPGSGVGRWSVGCGAAGVVEQQHEVIHV